MKIFPELYPARSRQQNIALIKGIRSVSSQEEFEAADRRISAALHPSLFAELDWMEMTMPGHQRSDGARLVDDIFIHHLGEIIARRSVEFDLPADLLDREVAANHDFYRHLVEDETRPLTSMDDDVRQKIEASVRAAEPVPEEIVAWFCDLEKSRIDRVFDDTGDPNWLLLKIGVEIKNAFALALDHVTSRVRSKQFLRKIGGQFPQLPVVSIDSDEDLAQLEDDLASLARAAMENGVFLLAATCRLLGNVVSGLEFAALDRFDGELGAGYGNCGNCSMMYASSAVVSLDPTCPGLFEGDDERIYLPANFNVSHCPFCGHESRAETPAMFFSPARHQVIYNFPRLGQFSEEEARNMHRPVISELRRNYLEKVDPEQARRFETAAEELTYGSAEFLSAIQMGTTAREEHVCLVAKLADGSGLVIDSTKGAMIGLTPTEMQSAWATARTVDIDAALGDEGVGGGPGVRQAMQAFASGDYERSRDILEKLYQKHPRDNVIRKNLAAAYISLGDKDSARRILKG